MFTEITVIPLYTVPVVSLQSEQQMLKTQHFHDQLVIQEAMIVIWSVYIM